MTERILEGFWDAIVAKTKRVGLAAGAAVGNKSAQGKLTAANLADQLYDGYKTWLGSTGEDDTAENMTHFLGKEVDFTVEFSNKWGEKFNQFMDDPDEFLDETSVSDANATSTSSPPGEPSDTTPKGKPPDEGTNVDQTGRGEFTPIDKSTRNMFKRHSIASGFTGDKSKYTFNKSPDGSIIVVPPGAKKAEELRNLMQHSSDAEEMGRTLSDYGYLKTWDEFKAENAKYSTDGDDLERDAMMTAAKHVGKNFSKDVNRFIVMKPEGPQSFQLKENMVFMETYSDGELRKFFTKVAQGALKSGEAKSAARGEMKRLRLAKKNGGNISPNPQATPKQNTSRSNSEYASNGESTTSSKPLGLDLSDSEQTTLTSIYNQAGGAKGAVDVLLQGKDPETVALAKKTMTGALSGYLAAINNKK